jgi:sugar-phosphatase
MELARKKIVLKCQAVIFDLDGTLIDSVQAIKSIWQEWANRCNIVDPNLLDVATSMRTIEAVRLLAPHLDIEQETETLENAEATELDGVIRVEGAREILLTLPRQSWGIVTSITRRTALAKLSHVDLPVPEVLVTSDDVQLGKPAPDGYLAAAERLGVAGDQCVVIEDTPPGIQAARAAGMAVIALATTHSAEQLEQANLIVSSLRDIKSSFCLDRGCQSNDSNHGHIRLEIDAL